MIPRIVCQVPGCTNSSAKFAECNGYLCARHWRCVPTRLKRRRSRIAGNLIKRGEVISTPVSYRCETPRAGRLLNAAWTRMVRAAVEAAAGL